MSFILLLKKQTKPLCQVWQFSRKHCSRYKISGDKWSFQAPFSASHAAGFYIQKKPDVERKVLEICEHNSSFYINEAFFLLTYWFPWYLLVVGKRKEKFIILLLEKAKINLHWIFYRYIYIGLFLF